MLLCGYSSNADRPGFSPSESVAGPNLEKLFGQCEGRIIVTCFASNIHRVQQVVDAAAVHGRKVVLIGRSMRKNINIGKMLGHIDVPDGMLVQPREAQDYPDHKLVILSTGSQGEPLRALRAGMIYVDGVDIGDPAAVALRDRRMLSADGIFVVVATVSEQTGESVAEPEIIFRGVPYSTDDDGLVDEIRGAVAASLARAAGEGIREIDLLQQALHDDLGKFVYERLRRRPMVLPVVVEV